MLIMIILAGTPKAIANKMQSKGLQKLRDIVTGNWCEFKPLQNRSTNCLWTLAQLL